MTNSSARSDLDQDTGSWNVLESVRQRWWVVALVAVVAVLAALAGTSQRTAKYEAEAEILVIPYTQTDSDLAGIRVVRASNDGARDLQTATALLTSAQNAQLVSQALNGRLTPSQVRDAVKLEPAGASSIVGVKVELPDPRLAVEVADTYARVALQQRDIAVMRQARFTYRQLQNTSAEDDPSLDAVRQQLKIFRTQGDVTLQISQAATLPTSPAGPSNAIILIAALICGLVLGVVGAVLLRRSDRRVKGRSDLLEAVPAPVLIGVPSWQRGHGGIDMPPAVRESFRTLQIQLDLRAREDCRRILITSASSGDGKTTVVLNLAFALVSAGHRVIVIDFDLRKPDIGRQLAITDPTSVVSTLPTGESLTEIMRPAPRLPPMRVVQVSTQAGDVALLPMVTRRIEQMLAETSEIADYVLIDTPPVGEVSDALPLVAHVDDVLVVGRPGATDQRSLDTMSGLFSRSGIEPTGWIVTGAEVTSSSYIDDAGTGGPVERLIRGLRSMTTRRPTAPTGR